MHKNRLEAFSDGVIAIIITIMVLELKVPHGDSFSELLPLLPVFLSYVLSFIYIGIYWNNHHHLLQMVKHVNGKVLLANMHLLFWLSLVPFVTAWSGENHFSEAPMLLYGIVLIMAAIAYFILTHVLVSTHGVSSELAEALGKDIKGKISVIVYVIALGLTFVSSYLALALYMLVAFMWFIPDQRMEKAFKKN